MLSSACGAVRADDLWNVDSDVGMLRRYLCVHCGSEGFIRESSRAGGGAVCPRCGGTVTLFLPDGRTHIVSILLFASGVLGYTYWVLEFFIPISLGKINLVPGNPPATAEFLYSILVLFSSGLALVFSPSAARGDREAGYMAGVGGIFSIGFYVGAALGAVGLLLVALWKDSFYSSGGGRNG